MRINFDKYHGAGNDFVLIDDRGFLFPQENISLIKHICSRHRGVGSDGLMLVRECESADFEMIFFNPDGTQSFCGNGSRCAVRFAKSLDFIPSSGTMLTTDGIHNYTVSGSDISIRMHDVASFSENSGHWLINTGSPHLIINVQALEEIDVETIGRQWRNKIEFESFDGCNVNFVCHGSDGKYDVRTYERGVEGETLSCGTGATAVALAMALDGHIQSNAVINTRGGQLQVDFTQEENVFSSIMLSGPAEKVFSGTLDA